VKFLLILFLSSSFAKDFKVLLWIHEDSSPTHNLHLMEEVKRQFLDDTRFQWISKAKIDSIIIDYDAQYTNQKDKLALLKKTLEPDFTFEFKSSPLQEKFSRDGIFFVTGRYRYVLEVHAKIQNPNQAPVYDLKIEADTSWSSGFCGLQKCKSKKNSMRLREEVHQKLLIDILQKTYMNVQVLLPRDTLQKK
jgi:hypothetical protein